VISAARFAGVFVLADDDPRWRWDPPAQAAAACAGGANVVQLRAKCSGDRAALAFAREIRELTRRAGVLFFVNDRFDSRWPAPDGAPGQTICRRAASRARAFRRPLDTPPGARCAANRRLHRVRPLFGTTSKRRPTTRRTRLPRWCTRRCGWSSRSAASTLSAGDVCARGAAACV
jgi:hypothetical protein